jgi:hypothetical protein
MDTLADRLSPAGAYELGLGMFHKDHEVFQATFWKQWAENGRTIAQYSAMRSLEDSLGNKPGEQWIGDKHKQSTTVSENERNNLIQTYQETQDYYKKELGADPDSQSLVVYRGIGMKKNENKHQPGTIESWTTDKATADGFAEMCAPTPEWRPVVLKVKTTYKHVFASADSLKGIFPDDRYLKGKREYIMLGNDVKNEEEA